MSKNLDLFTTEDVVKITGISPRQISRYHTEYELGQKIVGNALFFTPEEVGMLLWRSSLGQGKPSHIGEEGPFPVSIDYLSILHAKLRCAGVNA